MSIMTVPTWLYRKMLADTVGRYVKAGMESATAMQRAQEMMAGAFVSEDAVLDAEFAWDQHSPESNRWHE